MRATIFFLSFAVFIAAVVWRVDQVMFGDKLAWGEAQARTQISAMVEAVDSEVSRLRDILILGFSEIESGKKDFSPSRPYGRFHMVAKVLPPNIKEDRRDWKTVSIYYQDKSPTKVWATPYLAMALKSIRDTDVKPGSGNMYSLMDPSRKPYLLVIVRGAGDWYAGLVDTNVFQGLMDQQKGQKSTTFIVNLQGQALGHSIPEYTGNILTEDPIVTELIKASVSSGFGTFKDLKGNQVLGLYEQVERTNLFAVIVTPIELLTANRNEVRIQLILMGLGLAMIGLAVYVYTDRSGLRRPPLGSPAMARATSVTPSSATAVSPIANSPGGVAAAGTQAPLSQVKMSAYTHVASSLSHELKSPLASILGHAQLASAQSEGPAKEHLQKIENEARAVRDIVQKLLTFAGEDKVQSQKTSLENVVNRALRMVEGKLLSKGIKLHKNIQPVPEFTMAVDLVAKAVENILLNSIEAMERAPRKDLNVSLEAKDSSIQLKISDTGEGISGSDLPKVFDPFFTTRATGQHVGLGLSTALGIFKEASGEMKIDSELGKGSTVVVEFRPQDAILSATSASTAGAGAGAASATAAIAAAGTGTVPLAAPKTASENRNAATSKESVEITSSSSPAPLSEKTRSSGVTNLNSLPQAPAAPQAPVSVSSPSSLVVSANVSEGPKPTPEKNTSSPVFRPDDLPMDPLLVDNTIERMIEDDFADLPLEPRSSAKNSIPVASPVEPLELDASLDEFSDLSLKELKKGAKSEDVAASPLMDELATPAPATSSSSSPSPSPSHSHSPAPGNLPQFSSKIDKPRIDKKKKSSRLDEVQVAVRRPGDKS